MSVKPDGLLEDIKTANVFHHPVKAKILISILIFTFNIISIKYQIFNCANHRSFSCYLTLNPT